MRATLASSTRRLRRLTLPGSAVAAAVGLILSGCQTDTPVSNTNPDNIPTVPITAAVSVTGRNAAGLTTHHMFRTLGTVDKMLHPTGRASATGDDNGGNVNSPFDLSNFGGAVVDHAVNWNVYVTCPTTPADCWGTGNLGPANFLRDLNRSNFIRLANQYTGSDLYGQFPTGEITVDTLLDNPLTPLDIGTYVIAASLATGRSGYDNIFHIFLPAGVDVCLGPTDCYSPDDPANWTFCAFHASFDSPLGGHLLFTVEPYQNVPGCPLPGQTPHGAIDATASTLSHEFFETITDPDGETWGNVQTGEEVADLCFVFRNNEHLGRHSYVIQSEYSNNVHLCTDQP